MNVVYLITASVVELESVNYMIVLHYWKNTCQGKLQLLGLIFTIDPLFKDFPKGFAGGPAGYAATNAACYLLRAAAGDGGEIAEQTGQLVEKAP